MITALDEFSLRRLNSTQQHGLGSILYENKGDECLTENVHKVIFLKIYTRKQNVRLNTLKDARNLTQ